MRSKADTRESASAGICSCSVVSQSTLTSAAEMPHKAAAAISAVVP